MSDLIVYGFPRSTFVNIVRMVLTYHAREWAISHRPKYETRVCGWV